MGGHTFIQQTFTGHTTCQAAQSAQGCSCERQHTCPGKTHWSGRDRQVNRQLCCREIRGKEETPRTVRGQRRGTSPRLRSEEVVRDSAWRRPQCWPAGTLQQGPSYRHPTFKAGKNSDKEANTGPRHAFPAPWELPSWGTGSDLAHWGP